MWLVDALARAWGTPRTNPAGGEAWMDRIPSADAPAGHSSVFGTHIALNRTACPFSFLARREVPDTVRFHHGIMRGTTPDAIYTKDPILTGKVLLDKRNPKVRGWSNFHHRMFDYRTPPDIVAYPDADDQMLLKLRKATVTGLSAAFEQHKDQIEAQIERWVDEAARGPVELTRSTKRLNAAIAHLVVFGELPRGRLFQLAYRDVDSMLIDPKRRLAHLLWPVLDKLPTPYAVGHKAIAFVSRRLLRTFFNKYDGRAGNLLDRIRRQGMDDGVPDLAWRVFPFLIDAATAIPPFPMTMSLYLLAGQPDLQRRVVRENLYGEVIKETLRLYPAVPTIARIVRERVEGDGVVIEAMTGTEGQLYMNHTAIHRDPTGWARPDDFVIDRWLPGWTEDVDPARKLYLPFGLGARSCVGAAYAKRLLETFLRTVLTKRVVTNPSGQVPDRAEAGVSVVRRPFILEFSERAQP